MLLRLWAISCRGVEGAVRLCLVGRQVARPFHVDATNEIVRKFELQRLPLRHGGAHTPIRVLHSRIACGHVPRRQRVQVEAGALCQVPLWWLLELLRELEVHIIHLGPEADV